MEPMSIQMKREASPTPRSPESDLDSLSREELIRELARVEEELDRLMGIQETQKKKEVTTITPLLEPAESEKPKLVLEREGRVIERTLPGNTTGTEGPLTEIENVLPRLEQKRGLEAELADEQRILRGRLQQLSSSPIWKFWKWKERRIRKDGIRQTQSFIRDTKARLRELE